MEITVFILYSLWALYSGWNYVKAQGWCQGEGAGPMAGRIAASIGVGYFIGAWNIVKWAVMIGIRITDGFH